MPGFSSPLLRRAAGCGAIAALGLLLACPIEALPEVCPNVGEGELVISELRGDQSVSDSFGHYIEVYNASGKAVDLQGLIVRLRGSSGDELEFLVRDELELAAGDYAVIGPGLDEDHEDWIDYPINWDISGGNPETPSAPQDLLRYESAFVEIEACRELIDEVFYDFGELPEQGSLACGNAQSPPDAAANDDPTGGCWCVDAEENPIYFGIGLPGSPGSANRCP